MDLSRQNVFLQKFGNISDSFSKRILVIGCGGVGSPLCELLVRSGFENIDLVDFDVVDESNIQRQLYLPEDIGNLKIKALKKRMKKINPKVNITIFAEKVDLKFLDSLDTNYDLILDACDNFETRFVIDSFCKSKNIPWIYSGAIKAEMMCGFFKGKESNFDKIISKDAPNQDCSFGILGPATFTAASIVHIEVLKYFTLKNKYEPVLIKYNLWNSEFFKIPLKKKIKLLNPFDS